MSRRRFVAASAAQTVVLAGAASTVLNGFPALAQGSAANRVRIAVIGLHRGNAHVAGYLAHSNTEVAAVCDVDQRAIDATSATIEKQTGKRPKGVSDFRRILEDPSIDAVSIACPNHWHAPAAILACAAGKHVYVEKPGSHNAQEAEWVVAAARKHKRLVQMGNQRRSWPHIREAMQRLHSGEIGTVRYARAWYAANRTSIGAGKPTTVPEWLDYSLWQGPAPERPYLDNVVHYNWHWRWHWGGGELANNGIHSLDLVRWGLKVDRPLQVTCTGGRFHFRDDQETPDTTLAQFNFGHCAALWEGHSCHPRGIDGTAFGIVFQGEQGSMTLLDSGWKISDLKNKVVQEGGGRWEDKIHFANFIEAIRGNQTLNSEIAEGQRSTLLCHLGNIAWRTGRTLNLDAKTGAIVGDADAAQLWKREYRPGWEPRV